MNEFSLIELLKKKISRSRHAVLGIGDDAAVLKKTGDGNLVVSTDMLVEGVDFILRADRKRCGTSALPCEVLSPEKIGRKALAVNLSDLAAMGAEPLAFVISIGKPKHIRVRWLSRFYDGLLELARQFKVDCIGGDLSGAKEFSVSVTIIGNAKRFVSRSGAKEGDWIGVTGRLGGSILRHHWDFFPRIREGRLLAGGRFAHAMIDISDGLCQDLQHILRSSRVGAEVDLDRIPVSTDALRMCAGKTKDAHVRALTDGEDFELLFTVPASAKGRLEAIWKRKCGGIPLSWIGRILKGGPEVKWLLRGKRVGLNLSSKGFRHF